MHRIRIARGAQPPQAVSGNADSAAGDTPEQQDDLHAQSHRRRGRRGRGQEYGTGQRVGRVGSGPPSAAPAGEPAATKSHSLYFDFPL